MAFVKRILRTTISLSKESGQPTTFTEGGDTVKLPLLRTTARISKANSPAYCTMDLTIYGMTKSLMNQLSTLGVQINLVPKNKIVLEAGDEETGLTTVFVGYILAAYADFNASPEVSFHISAQAGLAEAVIPTTASSFEGGADVATIMSGLANKMGLTFENNGVSAQLSNSYYSGSLREQAAQCARDAGISMAIDLNVLAIWPKNGSRGGQIPIVSKATGMIGYPTYTAYGIMLKTIFNPAIGYGGQIEVQSSVMTTGKWAIYGLDMLLECETPDGKWESVILAYNPKYPTPVR